MLKFARETLGEVAVLEIEGQLDALTASRVKPTLDAMLENGEPRIVLKLDALELIDSSGIGLIVSVFKRVRALGGAMCLVGMKGQPREVFQLLKLEQIIGQATTVDGALEYVER